MAVPPVIQSYEGIRHTLEEGLLLPHVACHLAFVYPVTESRMQQVAGDVINSDLPIPVVVRQKWRIDGRDALLRMVMDITRAAGRHILEFQVAMPL